MFKKSYFVKILPNPAYKCNVWRVTLHPNARRLLLLRTLNTRVQETTQRSEDFEKRQWDEGSAQVRGVMVKLLEHSHKMTS